MDLLHLQTSLLPGMTKIHILTLLSIPAEPGPGQSEGRHQRDQAVRGGGGVRARGPDRVEEHPCSDQVPGTALQTGCLGQEFSPQHHLLLLTGWLQPLLHFARKSQNCFI